MDEYRIVVDCAIEYNGKYLFIERPKEKHAGGLLAFPGGKVEQTDCEGREKVLEKAVSREVWEEVGINLLDSPW